ncbi:MAG: hypothetical protein ACXVBW_01500, partial [Bdellovibrionota bacterium]
TLSKFLILATMAAFASCATGSNPYYDRKPIHNPFGEVYSGAAADPNQTMVLRTKRGDRAVEVQIPGSAEHLTDFVIPVGTAFRDTPGTGGARGIASVASSADPVLPNTGPDTTAPAAASTGLDDSYKDRAPTADDKEIASRFPQALPEDEGRRRDIESGLGLMQSEEGPEVSKSYLALLDRVKQLYKRGRFEAALIETDDLIKAYQTNPKLYTMRGTLLDRLGQRDMALKSWKQALRYEPQNATLRRFIERKEQKRSLASP